LKEIVKSRRSLILRSQRVSKSKDVAFTGIELAGLSFELVIGAIFILIHKNI